MGVERETERASELVPEAWPWWVAVDGYRWLAVKETIDTGRGHETHTEPHLVPAAPLGAGELRATFPLRDASTLCRTFAALQPGDQLAIQKFAREHGALGVWNEKIVATKGRGIDHGERLSDWSQAIERVRDALDLFDAAKATSAVKRRSWITWKPGTAVLRMPSGRTDRLDVTTKEKRRQLEAGYHVRHGDPKRAALVFAMRTLNGRDGWGLSRHAVARMLWNPQRQVPELRIQPRTLLGMILLQAAELAEEGVEHRPCAAPGCSVWFVVAPGKGFRSDKTTCSEAHRKRLERSRPSAPRAPRTRRSRR
jgi:hypothetical protein